MIHIILRILAIIGIIILCLLACLLVVLLSVLFVPIRYRAFGVHNGKETRIHVKITWFLHMLTAVYDFPEPGELRIKLFGFPLRMRGKRDGGAGSEENKEASKETVLSQGGLKAGAEENKKIPETGAKTEDGGVESQAREGEAPPQACSIGSRAKDAGQTKNMPAGKEKGRRKSVFARLKCRLLRLWRKIKYTIQSICAKIKKIAENFDYYKELLQEEENRLLYGRFLARIKKVVKHIRPSRLEARLLVGTGSPDTTGYLLAVYGMLLPLLGKHIDITPDFERPVLEGEFSVKGRIALFVLLVNGAGVYLDKQLHLLIGRLKREDV